MAILGILPQNIIYILCIIISSVIAMEFSLNIIKDKLNRQWSNSIFIKVSSYSLVFIIIFFIQCTGFLIETFIIPNIMKLIMV